MGEPRAAFALPNINSTRPRHGGGGDMADLNDIPPNMRPAVMAFVSAVSVVQAVKADAAAKANAHNIAFTRPASDMIAASSETGRQAMEEALLSAMKKSGKRKGGKRC